jgi:hypothetical protein
MGVLSIKMAFNRYMSGGLAYASVYLNMQVPAQCGAAMMIMPGFGGQNAESLTPDIIERPEPV